MQRIKSEWHADSIKKMDYYITAGDTPAKILEHYTEVSGRAPRMPEFGLGYWQCKLRYRNREELLAVGREHKRRGLPMFFDFPEDFEVMAYRNSICSDRICSLHRFWKREKENAEFTFPKELTGLMQLAKQGMKGEDT